MATDIPTEALSFQAQVTALYAHLREGTPLPEGFGLLEVWGETWEQTKERLEEAGWDSFQTPGIVGWSSQPSFPLPEPQAPYFGRALVRQTP